MPAASTISSYGARRCGRLPGGPLGTSGSGTRSWMRSAHSWKRRTDMPKTVTATRQLKATPERVFRAWTDPADVKRWFKPTRLIMEAKVDGLWHSEVEWQGKRWPHYGRFTRLERPRLFE